jgi:acyl dehydratase
MPLDLSFVGRSYPPSPAYEVGREKIREFATAVGDTNPVYHDPAVAQAHGYADIIAPPTFAIVISMKVTEQILFDPSLGLDYSKVVHSDQRFVYERPITAGDRLVGVASVDSIKAVMGNDMIGTKCVLSTESGELVAVAYGTLVARGTAA